MNVVSGSASLDATQRAALERYAALLLRRNAAQNLTAARTLEAVADHVHDSLSLLPYLREPFVDVGSGGGFPAIPLAIATGFRGTLIESVRKKARFLEDAVDELGLPLDVRGARVEDAGRDASLRGTFASATARAVASVPTVLEYALPLLLVGGVAVLQRGAFEAAERTAAFDACLVLGAAIDEEIPLGDEPEGRRILLVRKVAPTGSRFPRRAGIPAKRPLCTSTANDD